MSLLKDPRLLVVLLFFCAMAFGLRSREVFDAINAQGQAEPQTQISRIDPVRLAAIEPAADAEAEDDAAAATAGEGEAADAEVTEDDSGTPVAPIVPEEGWRDASEEEFEFSNIRSELFEDLAQRRRDLEKQERELAMRDALLKAAEREIDQKFKELESLRSEIEGLLEDQSAAEQERIEKLVKIYEGMRAKDAARIFNTLETEVLLSVLSRMSERKSAPIIAAMSPDRARSITILLAEQKKLPSFSLQ